MKHKRLLVLLIRNALITYIGVNILYLTYQLGFLQGTEARKKKMVTYNNCFVSLKKKHIKKTMSKVTNNGHLSKILLKIDVFFLINDIQNIASKHLKQYSTANE